MCSQITPCGTTGESQKKVSVRHKCDSPRVQQARTARQKHLAQVVDKAPFPHPPTFIDADVNKARRLALVAFLWLKPEIQADGALDLWRTSAGDV